MLKILHVIGPMATGGAQTQLLGLVRAAHGTLWDATVCGTSPGVMTERFRAAGIPVVELRRWGSPGLLRIVRLRRMVGAGDFDVVHSNLWQSNLYSRIAVIGRRSRPRTVISERGLDPERSGMARLLDRCLRSVTDVWVGNSQTVVEFIDDAHGLPHGTAVLVPNAVDKEIFASRDRIRQGDDPLQVGTVGRLTWEKGHEVLIAATRRLVDAGRDVEVHIGGDGPLRDDLRAAARGLPVRFYGEVTPGLDVARFLKGLDVFVLPSHQEGRPNALMEAMAIGLPVVVCDAPGSLEALDGGGMIVPRAAPDQLASAILEVSDRLREASAQAESAGLRIPGFDDLASKYLSIFEGPPRTLETPPRC